MKILQRKWAVASLFFIVLANSGHAQDSPDGVWLGLSSSVGITTDNRFDAPARSDRRGTIRLDETKLRAVLEAAPPEQPGVRAADTPGAVQLYLPNPGGQFVAFWVVNSPVMSPELSEKFPEIKTYAGTLADNNAVTVRLDITPAGLHAQVLDIGERWYIDPKSRGSAGVYTSYYSEDLTSNESRQCLVSETKSPLIIQSRSLIVSGNQLRTYRIAVATTGEYGAFHGGTVASTLAAVVTTINRVSGIYERELSVKLELIGNNDAIAFVDPATDPFDGNYNSRILKNESQSVIDSIIGSDNYDIGHTLGTGPGGSANPGVCVDGHKARGVTGGENPIGDPFDVDFVAHEIGHQFGASHTFNGIQGFCNGHRVAGTAYEIGSGSTIMAYAGICSQDDLQSNTDALFHSANHAEIVANISSGFASTCGSASFVSNVTPSADAGADYTIPLNTPFVLTGSAVDSDTTDVLTYLWEERDLGPAATLDTADDGAIPLQRVYTPTISPSRFMPRLSTLAANVLDPAQKLPQLPRIMNWRMTVRDGRGGVQFDDTRITVADNAGPFTVTSPNGGENLSGAISVTWDSANTELSPVSAPFVDIFLSTDGGLSFDLSNPLVSNTPNDGTHDLVLPNLTSTTVRLMVKGRDNVFFDMSDQNFSMAAFDPGVVLPNNSWRMISLPSIPPANANTVADLFGDDIAGGYGTTWQMWSYDSISNQFVDPLSTGVLSPGNAYWIIQATGADVTLDMPAGSTPTPHSVAMTCSAGEGCLPVSLTATSADSTWNMVGNPFYTTPTINSLRVSTANGPCGDADGCTLAEANAGGANVIHSTLFGWSGGPAYEQVLADAAWKPWTGYWSVVLPGANGVSPILHVPVN